MLLQETKLLCKVAPPPCSLEKWLAGFVLQVANGSEGKVGGGLLYMEDQAPAKLTFPPL